MIYDYTVPSLPNPEPGDKTFTEESYPMNAKIGDVSWVLVFPLQDGTRVFLRIGKEGMKSLEAIVLQGMTE